jgi:hypothetical protein
MHVSLQSKVYLGACVVIGAYNAYENPTRWITAFAIGVLAGTISGRSDLCAARDGHQPGNSLGMGWDSCRDQEIIKNAVTSLVNSAPGIFTTAINLLALGLISQKIQLPSNWNPKFKTYFCDFAALKFGYNVGKLFQLEFLCGIKTTEVQQLLADAVI